MCRIAQSPAIDITSSLTTSGDPLPLKITRLPLDRARVGDPESKSKTEWLKTDPLSVPGWLKPRLFTGEGEGDDEASLSVHESAPQESPEVPPFPFTIFTAR